jgi:transposase-like protein
MIQQYNQPSDFALSLPEPSTHKKRLYIKVSSPKKHQLIELVVKGQVNIKNAAGKLGINYSAAKHIIKLSKQGKSFADCTEESKAAESKKPKQGTTLNLINELGTINKTPELTATMLPITAEIVPMFDFGVYGAMICGR